MLKADTNSYTKHVLSPKIDAVVQRSQAPVKTLKKKTFAVEPRVVVTDPAVGEVVKNDRGRSMGRGGAGVGVRETRGRERETEKI